MSNHAFVHRTSSKKFNLIIYTQLDKKQHNSATFSAVNNSAKISLTLINKYNLLDKCTLIRL